jgi:hypothetical protein
MRLPGQKMLEKHEAWAVAFALIHSFAILPVRYHPMTIFCLAFHLGPCQTKNKSLS